MLIEQVINLIKLYGDKSEKMRTWNLGQIFEIELWMFGQ